MTYETMPNESGIYLIISNKTGKKYVGSAVSLRRRAWQHIHYLNKNKHHNKYLQNHFNKYGNGDLEIKIITTCDKQQLINEEQKYIDKINPEFNATKTAGSILGMKLTKEQAKKISDALTGRKLTKEHKEKISKNIKKRLSDGTQTLPVFDRKGKANGNYKHGMARKPKYKKNKNQSVQEWHAENLEKYGTKLPPEACEKRKGKGNPMFGKKRPEVSERMKMPRSIESVEKMSKAKSKEILQFTKDGIFLKSYLGQKQAAEAIGLSRAAIGHALLGLNPTAGGYVWKYKE